MRADGFFAGCGAASPEPDEGEPPEPPEPPEAGEPDSAGVGALAGELLVLEDPLGVDGVVEAVLAGFGSGSGVNGLRVCPVLCCEEPLVVSATACVDVFAGVALTAMPCALLGKATEELARVGPGELDPTLSAA